MMQLDLTSETLNDDVMAIIREYGDQAMVDESGMCFGFDRESNQIVLRLNDGERNTEIQLLDVSSLDKNLLNNIPQYWFGYPPDSMVNVAINQIKQKNVFDGNYIQFFKDANRIGLNGASFKKVREKVVTDNRAPSTFATQIQPTGFTKEENQKLNIYLDELASVDPHFTSEQKDTFFKLCSQNATQCFAATGINYDIVLGSESTRADIVTLNGELQLTVTSSMNMKTLVGMEKFLIGKYTAQSRFLIAKDGVVTDIFAEISTPVIVDETQLTSTHRFAIREFVENSKKVIDAYLDYALQKIMDNADLHARNLASRRAVYLQQSHLNLTQASEPISVVDLYPLL